MGEWLLIFVLSFWWRKIAMWRNFSFPCLTIVEKSEISPHLTCVWFRKCVHNLCCFVVKSVLSQFTQFRCEIGFVAIYTLLCGGKTNPKITYMWTKKKEWLFCFIILSCFEDFKYKFFAIYLLSQFFNPCWNQIEYRFLIFSSIYSKLWNIFLIW